MREGSLEAPTRHAIAWQDSEYTDVQKIDDELRRVFDICHGCRRCFNLCESFPRLFDLIDESKTGELDSVESKDFKPVVDACTLCDMCFMTKCPYVPPHEFDLDFPHLMLRYRAAELKMGKTPLVHRELGKTDRNGRLAGLMAPLVNWASKVGNFLTRPLMELLAGIHRLAELPRFYAKTFEKRAIEGAPQVNRNAPGFGRKAVIYATCFVNYNDPGKGAAIHHVLARNGVEAQVVHPACCGMPQLESGDVAAVAANAQKVAKELKQWIDKGHDIIACVPSCALMLKFEWPLILPDNEDVKALAKATFDVSEYIVDIAKKEGMAEGMSPLAGGVTVHISCHSRAQNMGQKEAELLRLIPDTTVNVIERCSGHGGSWGIMKENFDLALKVGKPVARQARKNADHHLASGCPLAGAHVLQGMERIEGDASIPGSAKHPVEVMALSYGFAQDKN